MKLLTLVATAIALCLITTEVKAEFLLQGADLPESSATPEESPAVKPHVQLPTPIAHGFGSQVPLAFAVRQIVPAKVRVRYGQHVDRNSLVDWKGGKPWPDTLRSAVKPLNLRVEATSSAVSVVN